MRETSSPSSSSLSASSSSQLSFQTLPILRASSSTSFCEFRMISFLSTTRLEELDLRSSIRAADLGCGLGDVTVMVKSVTRLSMSSGDRSTPFIFARSTITSRSAAIRRVCSLWRSDWSLSMAARYGGAFFVGEGGGGEEAELLRDRGGGLGEAATEAAREREV